MAHRSEHETSGCPFVESDDARCASHFTLGRLNQAFDVCMNGHHSCPIYYRLLRESQRAATLTITINGQPFAAGRNLRATGT